MRQGKRNLSEIFANLFVLSELLLRLNAAAVWLVDILTLH